MVVLLLISLCDPAHGLQTYHNTPPTELTSLDLNCFGAERFLPSLLPRWL